MKAKILGFFCSLLLLAASSKGQTIDGVLYTNFNNYYKWRGGAFDSTLLIPQIAASIGRRPGALRYSTADSSVYSWTGTQWQKVGGSNLTFSNGLTQSANNVKLGGILSEVTLIQGNGHPFIIQGKNDAMRGIILIQNDAALLSSYNNTGSGSSIQVDSSTINIFSGRGINPNHHIVMTTDSLILQSNSNNPYSQKAATNTDNQFLVLDTINNTVKRFTGTIQSDTATVVKAYVTNAESVTITKGQVVYIFGASGDRAAVKLAKNTSDTFSSKTLGIVRADIAAGQAGWVTTQGQVSGINLGAYTAGDILWLDSVAGGFTKTKPVAPKHGVFIGVVERANAGNGIIYVKPQNGVELSEVHDVLITSPTNNQVLSYTASTGIWENKTVSASIFAYTARTTTYTAGAEDYVIHCTSGTFSVNLPTAVGITGKVYIIKNSGSGLITIDPNGSQTIDGVTTYTMGQAESVQVISTGSNWITL